MNMRVQGSISRVKARWQDQRRTPDGIHGNIRSLLAGSGTLELFKEACNGKKISSVSGNPSSVEKVASVC